MAIAEDKWVRVMCDFSADGIWERDGVAADPAELPVSADLRSRLHAWQEWYEREAEIGDGFGTLDVASFSAEGLAIAKAVKAELPGWTVIYHDEAKTAGLYTAREINRLRSFFEYEV